jgi:hypothetical protein
MSITAKSVPTKRAHSYFHKVWARFQTCQNVTAEMVSVPTFESVPTVHNLGVGTLGGHGLTFTVNNLQKRAHYPTLLSLKAPGWKKKRGIATQVCKPRARRAWRVRVAIAVPTWSVK